MLCDIIILNRNWEGQTNECFCCILPSVQRQLYLSDERILYQRGFRRREAFYSTSLPVPEDVLLEQEKLDRADTLVFIYPDFWTASPAMLEGWFQRVLTYGYAYGDAPSLKIFDKALFFVTMGGSLDEEIRRTQVDAMKTVMIGDRLIFIPAG